MDNHSFNTDIACRYGIEEAILLQNIHYWIKKNKANDKNFYDEYYWSYSSVKAFEELFPYMSSKKIRNALRKLEENELILTSNYNKSQYDRTKWYTVTEKAIAELNNSICPKGKMEAPNKENENAPEGEPIPDINTDIKTDIKKHNVLFEKLWSKYPNKKGKGQVSDAKKKKLYDTGEKKLTRAIERYLKDYEKDKDWKKMQNGSTFFNSGYIDYLDENYVLKGTEKTKWKPVTFDDTEEEEELPEGVVVRPDGTRDWSGVKRDWSKIGGRTGG